MHPKPEDLVQLAFIEQKNHLYGGCGRVVNMKLG